MKSQHRNDETQWNTDLYNVHYYEFVYYMCTYCSFNVLVIKFTQLAEFTQLPSATTAPLSTDH